jgi:hypothetical protein
MSTIIDWALRYGLAVPTPFLAYQDRVSARPSHAAAGRANQSP